MSNILGNIDIWIKFHPETDNVSDSLPVLMWRISTTKSTKKLELQEGLDYLT
jgi:hypothetical protein